jgi:hypothetical protein
LELLLAQQKRVSAATFLRCFDDVGVAKYPQYVTHCGSPFLQHPAIAIWIGELGEAGVIPVRGVEPGCETSVPGIDGYLVPDLTDFDPTFEWAVPRSLDVGDDEIDFAK